MQVLNHGRSHSNDILMNQGQQPRGGEQDDSTLGSFQVRDGTDGLVMFGHSGRHRRLATRQSSVRIQARPPAGIGCNAGSGASGSICA